MPIGQTNTRKKVRERERKGTPTAAPPPPHTHPGCMVASMPLLSMSGFPPVATGADTTGMYGPLVEGETVLPWQDRDAPSRIVPTPASGVSLTLKPPAGLDAVYTGRNANDCHVRASRGRPRAELPG